MAPATKVDMSAGQPPPVAGASAASGAAAGAGATLAGPEPAGGASVRFPSGAVSVLSRRAATDYIDRHQALARM
eukprot:458738-Pleurochrysis_carterae.AAC.3